MSTGARVIRNTGWLYGKLAVTSVISLVTTRIILNSLGAADFGIYNVVGGAIAMLGFINAAMASATQRYLNYSEGEGDIEKQKSIFNVSIVLHAAIAGVMVIVLTIAGFIFFGGVLDIPEGRVYAAKIVYLCLVFSTAVTIMSAPFDAVLTSHENMRFYAFVGVTESVLKLAVALACLWTASDKLIVYGVLMALIPVASILLMLACCRRNYGECVFAPRKYFSRSNLKDMGGFAGWNFLGTSSMMICNYGQNILVNHFFGVLLNAAVGVVSQLTGLTMVFTNSMSKSVTPVIVKKAGSQQDEAMLKWSLTTCRFSFLLLAFVAIPICFETDYILTIWLKKVPEWTVLFVQLQMVRTMLEQVTVGLNSSLAASGDIKELNIQTAVIYISAFVLLYFLYKLGCAPSVLYIVMISAVFIQSVLKFFLCRKYNALPFGIFCKEVLLPILLISVLMSVGAFLPTVLMGAGFARLVISCSCCWVLTAASMWLFFLKPEEKETVLNLIKRPI